MAEEGRGNDGLWQGVERHHALVSPTGKNDFEPLNGILNREAESSFCVASLLFEVT